MLLKWRVTQTYNISLYLLSTLLCKRYLVNCKTSSHLLIPVREKMATDCVSSFKSPLTGKASRSKFKWPQGSRLRLFGYILQPFLDTVRLMCPLLYVFSPPLFYSLHKRWSPVEKRIAHESVCTRLTWTGDWNVEGKKNNNPSPPDGGSCVQSSDSKCCCFTDREQKLMKHFNVDNSESNANDSSHWMHVRTLIVYNIKTAIAILNISCQHFTPIQILRAGHSQFRFFFNYGSS